MVHPAVRVHPYIGNKCVLVNEGYSSSLIGLDDPAAGDALLSEVLTHITKPEFTLGDTCTLLIVRDLMFKGRKTFKEFLEAAEGIASNILTNRLQRLEALAIIPRREDPDDARKFDYRLTKIGIYLAPTLLEMIVLRKY